MHFRQWYLFKDSVYSFSGYCKDEFIYYSKFEPTPVYSIDFKLM